MIEKKMENEDSQFTSFFIIGFPLSGDLCVVLFAHI